MGSPHESERVTSALRLVQALLEQDRAVQVWACGYATLLTQTPLGEDKPRNLANWNGVYPSTAALVKDMLETFPAGCTGTAAGSAATTGGGGPPAAGRHAAPLRLRRPRGRGCRTLQVGVL
ncbi:hypothetical protein ACR6C2_37900 [Streptomyces sp. INA 01156]